MNKLDEMVYRCLPNGLDAGICDLSGNQYSEEEVSAANEAAFQLYLLDYQAGRLLRQEMAGDDGDFIEERKRICEDRALIWERYLQAIRHPHANRWSAKSYQ